MKPALLGFSVIAVFVAVLGYLVPDQEVRRPMWLFIFLILAICTKFCWSHPDAPKSSTGWLGYIGMAALTGIVFASVDALLHGTSSMSIVFDLFLSLCGGIVAFAGFCRAYYLERTANG